MLSTIARATRHTVDIMSLARNIMYHKMTRRQLIRFAKAVINHLQTTSLDPSIVSVRVFFALRSTDINLAFNDLCEAKHPGLFGFTLARKEYV